MENSLGEKRVRTDFNVNASDSVGVIKHKTAELINVCESMRTSGTQAEKVNSEKLRLISLAQTAYEEAAMWAVKAATI